jgi:acetyl esterase/lipase
MQVEIEKSIPKTMKTLKLLSFLLLITATSHAQPKIVKDIKYATTPEKELSLDLYMPTNAVKPALMVWIHGGAWSAGSKENPPTEFIEHGFALASINYRLSGEAKFPAQIHDIKAAIRFLRANAKKYGFDADKIIIWGSSAGGHLAALAGVTNENAALEGTLGENLQTSSKVQAILDYYGPTNLTTILKQSTPHGLNVRTPALELLFGKPVKDTIAELNLASPVFHVDKNDPPLFICHGDQDIQVPINQSIELYGKYKQAGLKIEMEFIYGAGHGGKEYTNPVLIEQVLKFLKNNL